MRPAVALASLALLLCAAAPAGAAQSPLAAGYAPPGTTEQAATAPASGDTGAVKGEGQGLAPPATSSTTSPAPKATTAASVTPAPTAASQQETTQRGTLPFTGLDVGMVALAGMVLLGLGMITRRVATRYDG